MHIGAWHEYKLAQLHGPALKKLQDQWQRDFIQRLKNEDEEKVRDVLGKVLGHPQKRNRQRTPLISKRSVEPPTSNQHTEAKSIVKTLKRKSRRRQRIRVGLNALEAVQQRRKLYKAEILKAQEHQKAVEQRRTVEQQSIVGQPNSEKRPNSEEQSSSEEQQNSREKQKVKQPVEDSVDELLRWANDLNLDDL